MPSDQKTVVQVHQLKRWAAQDKGQCRTWSISGDGDEEVVVRVEWYHLQLEYYREGRAKTILAAMARLAAELALIRMPLPEIVPGVKRKQEDKQDEAESEATPSGPGE